MKWRSYSVAGGGWYDLIVTAPRFSREWWRLFWECALVGNYSFYTNKWFGWKIWLSPKNRRLIEMLDELEKQ